MYAHTRTHTHTLFISDSQYKPHEDVGRKGYCQPVSGGSEAAER